MKISKLTMLSMIAALFAVPFSNVMAEGSGGCDYDLRTGAVYVNENRTKRDDDGNAQQNRLIVLSRGEGGALTEVQRVESGGYGNDDGIVTSGQFSVIVQNFRNRQYVMMINAGFDPTSDSLDGSVSAFRVNKCGVTLTDTASTKGQEPRSVSRDARRVLGFNRDLVGVVNAGSGEVEFNGCPGLPVGFLTPVGSTCGERPPVENFEGTSYIIYRFNNRRGTFRQIARNDTLDENGDPAQMSFINEGRQMVISQRNTFFALGNGTEDDIIEVVKLRLNGRPMKDRSGFATTLANFLGYNAGATDGQFNGASPDSIAPRFSNPVISETTGNDNFGFSVLPVAGEDFNDCVIMTHGSFQQRGQGGTSQFRINKFGAKVRIQPNKPDLGDDTCWSQISTRTGTLYAQAFFNSGISIRSIDLNTCVVEDGGPPVIVVDGVPQFGPLQNIRHRISSSPQTDANGGAIPTDQSDFLYQAGGLDMALSQNATGTEYLYALNTPVPFAGIPGGNPDGSTKVQNSSGDFLWIPGGPTTIAIYEVIEDCDGVTTIFKGADADGNPVDDCRPGDLVLVDRYAPGDISSSGFGIAAM